MLAAALFAGRVSPPFFLDMNITIAMLAKNATSAAINTSGLRHAGELAALTIRFLALCH